MNDVAKLLSSFERSSLDGISSIVTANWFYKLHLNTLKYISFIQKEISQLLKMKTYKGDSCWFPGSKFLLFQKQNLHYHRPRGIANPHYLE
jgi:hypothetical protein